MSILEINSWFLFSFLETLGKQHYSSNQIRKALPTPAAVKLLWSTNEVPGELWWHPGVPRNTDLHPLPKRVTNQTRSSKMFHHTQAHVPTNQPLTQLREHFGFTAMPSGGWTSTVHVTFPEPRGQASSETTRQVRARSRQTPCAQHQGKGEGTGKDSPTGTPQIISSTVFILTLKNRKVGTELISYFSDTSGTASASNFKIKEFKHDYKKVFSF